MESRNACNVHQARRDKELPGNGLKTTRCDIVVERKYGFQTTSEKHGKVSKMRLSDNH